MLDDPHGAGPAPGQRRHLIHGKPTDHTQEHDLGLVRRERGHQPVHCFLRAQLLDCHDARISVASFGRVTDGVERNESGPAGRPPAMVGQPVPGDGEQPRPERGVITVERVEPLGDSQPDLAGEVIGGAGFERPEEAQYPGLVGAEELLERGNVTRTRPSHDGFHTRRGRCRRHRASLAASVDRCESASVRSSRNGRYSA